MSLISALRSKTFLGRGGMNSMSALWFRYVVSERGRLLCTVVRDLVDEFAAVEGWMSAAATENFRTRAIVSYSSAELPRRCL